MLSAGLVEDLTFERKTEDVLAAYDDWKKEINAGRVLRK